MRLAGQPGVRFGVVVKLVLLLVFSQEPIDEGVFAFAYIIERI